MAFPTGAVAAALFLSLGVVASGCARGERAGRTGVAPTQTQEAAPVRPSATQTQGAKAQPQETRDEQQQPEQPQDGDEGLRQETPVPTSADVPKGGPFSFRAYAEAYEYQADSDLELGSVDTAVGHYSAAIRLYPVKPVTYLKRGIAYIETGQLESAIDDFGEALELDPENDAYYYIRGVTYLNLGDLELARKDLEEAARINPQLSKAFFLSYTLEQEADSYANRARAFTLLGRDDEAREDFEKAVELGYSAEKLSSELAALRSQR